MDNITLKAGRSLAAGLLQQQEDIRTWKRILTREAADQLDAWAVAENSKLTPDSTRLDVWRGQSISECVQRLALNI